MLLTELRLHICLLHISSGFYFLYIYQYSLRFNASVISGDPKDRSSLSVFRSVGGTVAGIMIGVVAPMLVYKTDAYGNQVVSATNISIVAGVFSVIAIVCLSALLFPYNRAC